MIFERSGVICNLSPFSGSGSGMMAGLGKPHHPGGAGFTGLDVGPLGPGVTVGQDKRTLSGFSRVRI